MAHNAAAQERAAVVSWEASEFTVQRADAALAKALQIMADQAAREGAVDGAVE